MSNTINVLLEFEDEAEQYFKSSAKLRGLSRTALVRKLIQTIIKDQLILSILDDEDEVVVAEKPKRPRGRPVGSTNKPKSLYSGVGNHCPPSSVPQRRHGGPPRRPEQTKNEMMEDLRQAVLNTGGVEQ